MRDTNKDGKDPETKKAWLCKKESWGLILYILFFPVFVWAVMFFDLPPSVHWTTNRADFLKIVGGGLLAAFGLYLSFRRTKEVQRQNDITKDHNQAEELQENLQSGIEHLGHDNEGVRIGGIYELYNLAKDHEKQRHIVQDILCAHVRKRSNDKSYAKTYHEEDERGYQVAEEIQTILNILCKKEQESEETIFKSFRLDFKEAALQRANLQGANLQGANLRWVKLQLANLQEASLKGASLQWVKLESANLEEASLQGANLQGANLQETNLQGANLLKANLQWANLKGANLQEANLQEAELEDTIINYGEHKHLPDWVDLVSLTWEPKRGTMVEYIKKHPGYSDFKTNPLMKKGGIEATWLTRKKPKAV